MIAHRGNINGPNPERENAPDYIQEALDAGYDVEVDLWHVDGKWFLGHDEPKYEIDPRFLVNENLWIHCKNTAALDEIQMMMNVLSRLRKPNYFWHEEDERTLTSQGLIWTYPGKELAHLSIAVLPERFPDWDISKAIGFCSDYIATIIDRLDDE